MNNAVAVKEDRNLVSSMAEHYEMSKKEFVDTIKGSVIKGEASDAQFMAFLMVAKEHNLNPLTKEIYAFPSNGGIQPIVSVDGWMKLINLHPQFDGMEFQDTFDESKKLIAIECRMYRKDRTRPVVVTEYMSECSRGTEPWKKWPARMLRHKAAIQAARYAFGFSGFMEPDEYERMGDPVRSRQEIIQDPLNDDIIEVNTVEPSVDDEFALSSSTEGGESAEASAALDIDLPADDFNEAECLRDFAKAMIAAIGPDISIVTTQAKEFFDERLSERGRERARSIVKTIKEVCRNEIEKGDAIKLIASYAGVDEKELLK